MKIKLKTMIKRIYNFLFGFSECSKCENFEECDLRVWLHRSGDNCNYGTRNERQGLGHSKPIEQYDLEGNFIKEWESAAEVEKVLGFNHSNISKCCLGRYNVAYNYKWKFK